MKIFRFSATVGAIALLVLLGCEQNQDEDSSSARDYRQDMRGFIQEISAYAKTFDSDFIVIPQNGQELITQDGEAAGPIAASYIAVLSGLGREDLFYGYDNDNVLTPVSERDYLIEFLEVSQNNGLKVLVTDYCWTPAFMDNSYQWNADQGFTSFAADHRELDNIPAYPAAPYNVNVANITTLTQAQNFLYLLNSETYASKQDFLTALQGTSHDLIITDLFFQGDQPLTSSEVTSLKTKQGGGSRLVISYLSIGEAEDYRYYWQPSWATNPPAWLEEQNPDWPGNYKVQYWDSDWQNIIYGNDNCYAKKIIELHGGTISVESQINKGTTFKITLPRQ